MTKKATHTTRATVASKPAVPHVEPDAPREYEEIDETHRVKLLPHDVKIYEELVERGRVDRQHNTIQPVYYWQPYAKETPVLLITNPLTFTARHEEALRYERHQPDKQLRKIRGALRKHQQDGELFFELGRSDSEMDDLIDYAIELLKAYGVRAVRAIRISDVLSRGQW